MIEKFDNNRIGAPSQEDLAGLHQEALRVNEELDEQKEGLSKDYLSELIIREKEHQIRDQFHDNPEAIRAIEILSQICSDKIYLLLTE